jgi:transcriptional antiterminator NusG
VNGVWKTVHKTLFPGYLFVNTDKDRIESFAERIRHSDQFAVVLSTDDSFTPVSDEEVFLIDNAYSNNGVLGSSIGIIEGDRVKILSGPLIGKEGLIKSINRHKRSAIIELIMFGRVSTVKIGLEIISKT